jgi:hypothetical protein
MRETSVTRIELHSKVMRSTHLHINFFIEGDVDRVFLFCETFFRTRRFGDQDERGTRLCNGGILTCRWLQQR